MAVPALMPNAVGAHCNLHDPPCPTLHLSAIPKARASLGTPGLPSVGLGTRGLSTTSLGPQILPSVALGTQRLPSVGRRSPGRGPSNPQAPSLQAEIPRLPSELLGGGLKPLGRRGPGDQGLALGHGSASGPGTAQRSKGLWRSPPAVALFRGQGSVMGAGADPIKEWICSPQGGGASVVKKTSPVLGGCINSAYRYDTDNGSFFVKVNRGADAAMFEAEALGLQRMFDTHTIRVPRPFVAGPLPNRGSYIIMEFIEFGGSRGGGQAELGRQLGLLHKAGTSPNGKFGFDVDNTIGSTPQKNPWTDDWVTFFRDHRLGFQLELIRKEHYDNELYKKGRQLMDRVSEFFEGVDVKPCLLHGDLWSGNIASDSQGAPVILDPATYYGHSEAEFGMSWCASFGQEFYKAYFEVIPKVPGFEDRVALYKLYHYLNHYNLFGSSYRSSCMSIISNFN